MESDTSVSDGERSRRDISSDEKSRRRVLQHAGQIVPGTTPEIENPQSVESRDRHEFEVTGIPAASRLEVCKARGSIPKVLLRNSNGVPGPIPTDVHRADPALLDAEPPPPHTILQPERDELQYHLLDQ
jgi:hypothetical protein